MTTLQMKMVSSLEKCFLDDPVSSKPEANHFHMFQNERLSFQVMYRAQFPAGERLSRCPLCPVEVKGPLAPYAKIRMVINVPNAYPTYNESPGGEFIRTDPGLYPDQLRPLPYPDSVYLVHQQTHAFWVDIDLPEGFPAGNYEISVAVRDENNVLGTVTGHVDVLPLSLPKQTLIHTEWLYTDCIANYYHAKVFSKQHWKYIENFIHTATDNGINMIFTPVFTPELDTYIGGERLTTQLVDIELDSDGTYHFDFGKLHHWIDLCLKHGVEYFEIPHFFSQWGATATPKIIVKVNGRKKKLFGWHTNSLGSEYKSFLSQFIPALLGVFKERGLDQKCFFHISDEPALAHLEHYRKCKEIVAPYLEGYPIIDALSNLEFYTTGAIEKPVPNTRNALDFYKAGVPGLWTYYCGGGRCGVSDRSMAMPSHRTRILGVQLYYYNIEGFLHWGYNFYNTRFSCSAVDPFGNPDGFYFTPTGDNLLVYPGTDGTAWGSLRLNALREAMDDIRALRLYEEKFGRTATEALILEGTDGEFTFTHYPTDPMYLPTLREKIASALSNI